MRGAAGARVSCEADIGHPTIIVQSLMWSSVTDKVIKASRETDVGADVITDVVITDVVTDVVITDVVITDVITDVVITDVVITDVVTDVVITDVVITDVITDVVSVLADRSGRIWVVCIFITDIVIVVYGSYVHH